MRHRPVHFAIVAFYMLFFSVILPGHDHSWLRMDADDECQALVLPSIPTKGSTPTPERHDGSDGCAFCQFAARISHNTAPPPIVPSLLPLNYVVIAAAPAYVPANPRLTSDSRGPPVR